MNNNNSLKFLDIINCMGFALTLANYEQNLQQSDNDDIMQELDKKTNLLIQQLEADLEQQNIMLKKILQELERLKNDSN